MRNAALIVPAFNEAELLPATLAALREASASAPAWRWEIVVVDNNSTDATAAIAAEAGARVVFEPHNQIARARNAGAAAALDAELLIFVDADTLVSGALIRAAVAAIESGSVAGGGATIEFDRPVNTFAAAGLQFWTALSRRFRWVAGSFVFVRREAFDDIGGFSEHYYAGEEIDFSRRLGRWARRHGLDTTIVTGFPVTTSSRKFHWHTTGRMAAIYLLLSVFPFLVRSRRWCGLWYQRPGSAGPPPTPQTPAPPG